MYIINMLYRTMYIINILYKTMYIIYMLYKMSCIINIYKMLHTIKILLICLSLCALIINAFNKSATPFMLLIYL